MPRASIPNAARSARGILQIAHFRVLNELRRRSRQPDIVPDPEGLVLDGLPARDPGPPEAASRERRRAIIRSAFEELPPPQRQALSLAFLDDLTHEQVAAELNLPLGTAKTRIRAGLQKLRGTLGAQMAALVALCLLAALGVRQHAQQVALERYDHALSMVTSSDSVNLRLGAVPGTPGETHARYRGRPGATIAVVTFSRFPGLQAGQTYQVWVRHGGTWTSLGSVDTRRRRQRPADRREPGARHGTRRRRGDPRAPTRKPDARPTRHRLLDSVTLLTAALRSLERSGMANDDSPEYGTLVTAALLILALAFAGYWIYSYVGDTGTPLAPWFGVAAIVIVVFALLNYMRTGGRTP